MSDVKWIKVTTDVFDNRKIRMIENMPESDTILVIWFKILCLAGSVNEGGSIMLTKDIPYTDEMLAQQFNRPLSVIRLALHTFQRFGMIDVINDMMLVSNWEKYQNIDGLEKIREQNRLRVKNHREKKQKLHLPSECNVTGNVTVTHCNAIDIDKEKEEEEDKDREIRENGKKKRKADISLDQYNLGESLDSAIRDFIENRKQLKAPMTQRALDIMIKKLFEMTNTESEMIAILEQSITSGYKGIFPVKKQSVSKGEENIRRIMDL